MDLSKTILTSDTNAFKNVARYDGTIVFPTSLAADASTFVTVTIPMEDLPKFSNFSAYFLETSDANYGIGSAQWYNNSIARNGVAIENLTFGGFDGASVYPVLEGSNVVVTGFFQNAYGVDITMAPLSVPFSFVEYTVDS